ncbi:MAG TPA: 16S rRNA (adenine(1518)-N(6)/adenine(1519)-N(6))-dimethyltransferase RsmA [Chloroflexota bacterium]|nr:16S rRNA (adenine(1518)-N(6)/adenine(1519)-N(6))-dimethyltransferase RsmA [Chloroflexota bacterium]
MQIDLTRPQQVGDLLSRHGIWLSKSMGQHLLVDATVLERIVAAADLPPSAEVLEVGPGVGTLTRALSQRAARVVAVELDRRFVEVLRETVPAANVELVQADALAVDLPSFFGGRSYRVVSNLPYGVATPLVRRLLYAEDAPREMVVMLQREVAMRLAAPPGEMSRLSVEAQLVADVDVLFEVPPEAFFPPPDVSSAVVQLRHLGGFRVAPRPDLRRFFQTVEAGFRQRRKQLHNALGELGVGTERIRQALDAAGVDAKRRAETLTLEEWSRLSEALWPASQTAGSP